MREPSCTPRSAVDEVMAMAYHILVVEDEPDTRELPDFTLPWNGHHVDTATNGREALDLLAEHSYNAILSNLNMPEMDGEDLAILGVVAFSCSQASATPNGAGETSTPRLTCSFVAHSLGRL